MKHYKFIFIDYIDEILNNNNVFIQECGKVSAIPHIP